MGNISTNGTISATNMFINNSQVLHTDNWYNYITEDNFCKLYSWVDTTELNVDTLGIRGMGFVYDDRHNSSTSGPFLAFGGNSWLKNYTCQINANYYTGNIFTRVYNGDAATWLPWKRLAFDGEISSDHYGSSNPSSSTSGYGTDGSIYYKIL